MKIFLNWLLFLITMGAIIVLVWHRHWIGDHLPSLPVLHLSPAGIIILAFSCAFVWVYVLKWWKQIKPFNCVTCLTGWFSLIIGCWVAGWFGVIYMPVGMTVAALYSEVRMRWL